MFKICKYILSASVFALLSNSNTQIDARQYDDRFVLRQPLSNSTFNHWKTTGQAVILKEKVVLTPEQKNMHGLLYAKNTFNLQDFVIEVDVSIHNKMSSSYSRGDFRLYILRDNPMKSAVDFATGLDDQFDGFQLHINEGNSREMNPQKGQSKRKHEIIGILQDEQFNRIDNKETSNCEMMFDDQTIFIHSEKNSLVISFKDPATGKESLKPCFKIDLPEYYFSEDHDNYLFMSAFSGAGLPNEHLIHNIKFSDSKHLHDSQEIDSEEDKRAFYGKAMDVLRKGAITQNDQFTFDGYNRQLARHNNVYSQLVSEFISNSEAIISQMNNLPHHDVSSNMSAQAESMSQRFTLLNQQFIQYKQDMDSYKEYTQSENDMRQVRRNIGDENDQGFIEQSKIIEELDDISKKIDGYTQLMNKNHLLEEITEYDKNIKKHDMQHVNMDDSIIKKLDGSDEYMSKNEMQILFSQQIRKIMSTQVKQIDQDVRFSINQSSYGHTTKFVDIIMYLSILFVIGFGYLAYKKLQDQKNMLVL